MRHERGTTLLDLMASLGATSVVIGAVAAVVLRADADRRLADGLADDAAGLRRAATALERDVRCASSVAAAAGGIDLGVVAWRLDDGTLTRDGTPVVRRVAEFDVARGDGGEVRARIGLAARVAGASRHAAVTVVASPRAEGVR